MASKSARRYYCSNDREGRWYIYLLSEGIISSPLIRE